jgi:hypothetical protein
VLLPELRGASGSRHAEGLQPALVEQPQRLVGIRHGVIGVDPLGEVPQLLAAFAAGRRDLAAGDHQLEQHLDVLVVVPSRRGPRHLTGVLERAGRQRPLPSELVEDLPSAPVVGLEPRSVVALPLPQRLAARPQRHLGAEQREVLARPEEPLVVDQHLPVDQVGQLCAVVGRPEPAPQDQVGARRPQRGGRLGLEHHQVPRHVEHVDGTWQVQPLRLHADPAGVRLRQLVDHAVTLSTGADTGGGDH